MMRTIAILAAAAAIGGCKTKNPYDTTSLEIELETRSDRVIELERLGAYYTVHSPDPQIELGEMQPNLDAWRATDVQKADAATLLRMEAATGDKIGVLERQLADAQSRPQRVTHFQMMMARNDLVVERKKLTIIQIEMHNRYGISR